MQGLFGGDIERFAIFLQKSHWNWRNSLHTGQFIFFKKFLLECYQSVKLFGSKLGPTWHYVGPNLGPNSQLAKFINRQQKSPLANKELNVEEILQLKRIMVIVCQNLNLSSSKWLDIFKFSLIGIPNSHRLPDCTSKWGIVLNLRENRFSKIGWFTVFSGLCLNWINMISKTELDSTALRVPHCFVGF